MLDIYVASKIHHAKYLIGVRQNLLKQDININSRWLYQAQYEETSTPDLYKIFWGIDFTDIHNSNAVLIYAEEGDKLRGALVEAGIAIALNKPVIVIGDHLDYGTWQHHQGVYRAKTFDEAIFILKSMFHSVHMIAGEI